ncbi:hypothetical protein MMC10_002363 [Thelotrema lepadinum]|nr:hypothetical protein [Thelotrema lepadinum]
MAFQLNIKLSYIQLTAEDINQEKESTEWFETIQTVPSPTLEILKSYSGLKEDKIIPHIEEVRARAFKAWPYPYIGQLRFLYLNLSKHPYYETLLSRLRTGATFLDAGCYFGQDLRKLLLDGALASEALYGPDIDRAFLDLGYELFRDKANFHGSLLEVDILKDTAPVSALDDSKNVIAAFSLLHVFSLEQQVQASKRLVYFLL